MIQNYSFYAGKIEVSIPQEGRPEGCPESMEIDLDYRVVSWDDGIEPELPPESNWDLFRNKIFITTVYPRLAISPGYADLSNVFWQLHTNPQLFSLLPTLWKMVIENLESPLTENEIEEINTILIECNIPCTLNSSGLME
jgi:hypothetical protein